MSHHNVDHSAKSKGVRVDIWKDLGELAREKCWHSDMETEMWPKHNSVLAQSQAEPRFSCVCWNNNLVWLLKLECKAANKDCFHRWAAFWGLFPAINWLKCQKIVSQSQFFRAQGDEQTAHEPKSFPYLIQQNQTESRIFSIFRGYNLKMFEFFFNMINCSVAWMTIKCNHMNILSTL